MCPASLSLSVACGTCTRTWELLEGDADVDSMAANLSPCDAPTPQLPQHLCPPHTNPMKLFNNGNITHQFIVGNVPLLLSHSPKHTQRTQTHHSQKPQNIAQKPQTPNSSKTHETFKNTKKTPEERYTTRDDPQKFIPPYSPNPKNPTEKTKNKK